MCKLTLPLLENNRQDKDCRPCSACCVVLPIAAGHLSSKSKPPGVPCCWLANGACRIHSQRFELCRRFQCAWLADPTWQQSWRPDLVGLLCLREWIDEKVPAAIVYELHAGAIDSPEAVEILAKLCQTTVSVTLIRTDGTRKRLVGTWKPKANNELITLGQIPLKSAA